jgi:5-methylcytosine-specific restriction endonuclease McrA
MTTSSAPQIISRQDAKASGLPRYYTAKPCPAGHMAERFVSTCGCVECVKAAKSAWAKANPEKVKAYMGAWTEANPEKRKANGAAYYERNPAKYMAKSAAWREANPDKVSLASVAYYEANAEAVKVGVRNYQARKGNAPGSHTVGDIAALHRQQNSRCNACGADFAQVKVHVDHIVPLAKGGANGADNLQLLCGPCNQSKGTKDNDAFLREMKAFGALIGASGRARFEARGQEHDDLVLAVALALWQPTESKS